MNRETEYPKRLIEAIGEYRKIQAPAHLHSQVMQKIEQTSSRAWVPRLSFVGAGTALAVCSLALVVVTAKVENDSNVHTCLNKPIPSLASVRTPSMTSINISKYQDFGAVPSLAAARIRFPSRIKLDRANQSEALLYDINNSSQTAV
jgi:hypothetical protein